MSGRRFYNNSITGELSRRSFLLRAGIVTTGIFLNGCIRKFGSKQSYKNIPGTIKGPNSTAGHVLRDKISIPPSSGSRTVKTLIIGSGISGLSAGRWLKKQGYNDFEILELENHTGGNAFFGKNEVSAYPLGAHYITIANNEDKPLTDFLQENDVITGFQNNMPVYNEYYLCFDPEERLLLNGQFQEGLVPEFGVPDAEKRQIKKFFQLIDGYKNKKGTDGKYAFDIPIANSSADEDFRKLDKVLFADYLKSEGFTSPYLLWYLHYCCKDDYGQKADKVSAWAGLHYFASRRGKAANADTNAVLTWPEGNGWLMKRLAEAVDGHVTKNQLCYQVKFNAEGKAEATIYDIARKTTNTVIAEKIILATPQFVNQKLLVNAMPRKVNYSKFSYSPWLIANITVNHLPQAKGTGLCWDNVAYDTASVGYVNARQQSVKLVQDKTVLTWYLPLCDREPRLSRLAAYTRTYEQWLDIMIPELEYMHPGITGDIEKVECWLWGHGMIAPTVDFIWGSDTHNARQPVDNKLFFAHTDLSGISIFEEAFHHGIRAANEVLATYGKQASL